MMDNLLHMRYVHVVGLNLEMKILIFLLSKSTGQNG